MLSNVRLSESNDRWTWDAEGTGCFSVANVKRLLRSDRDTYRRHVMKWESWIPLKVNLLAWRLEMDRLPTRVALVRRCIDVQDVSCPLCQSVEESSKHVFSGCCFTFGVWSIIGKWCKIDPIFAFDIEDLLLLHQNAAESKWAKKIIRGIVMISCWAIWNERNKKVFQGENPSVVKVVATVKSLSFLWLKSRARFNSLHWKDWVCSPLYML